MSRRLAREIVIQTLYQLEIHPDDIGIMVNQLTQKLNEEDLIFYKRLKEGVLEHQEEIDKRISPHLKKGWPLERLSIVDRAILRLAVYELFYEEKTPHKAILNEAVDLAKAFGGDESGRFINGVLGGVVETAG